MIDRPDIIRLTAALLVGLAASAAAPAGDPPPDPRDADTIDYNKLAQMSLQELMSTEVTSVAGVAQEWFKTPAAMYVVTNEEARRSGFLTLADTLRVVPGVFVGTVNSQSRSVGTRGFNGGFANKTLVMIDGRTVYDPLFGGVNWDVQDILLEDLDRIEVIRGPGPTLWGANAVNGVINVTTKSAKDTQGFYLAGGGGDEERGFGQMRYGGQLADNVWFRVWGKYFNRDSLDFPGGLNAQDDWDMARGGFRVDAEDGDGGKLTIDSDLYSSDHKGERVQVPVFGAFPPQFFFRIGDGRAEGGHFLARYVKDYDDGSGWSLQAYYDRTSRVQSAEFQVDRNTADIESRHHFHPLEDHELVSGLRFNSTTDHTDAGPTISLDPRSRTINTFSGFIQDTWTLVPHRLFAMGGTKLEYNSMTGFEVQPSGRVWWTPSDRQTLWAAVSRPVRIPSRLEEDGTITVAYLGTTPVAVAGNPNLDAEEVLAYELGHRIKVTRSLTLDTTLFYNDYRRLVSAPANLFGPPTFQSQLNNNGRGQSYGGELTLTWQIADNWRAVAGYSYVNVLIQGPVFNDDQGNTPHNQAQLRSYLDITRDLELNAGLYYVDNIALPDVDHYLRFDVGMTWRLSRNFEIAAWGQNVLDPRHREFTAIEAERGFYVMGTVRF